MKFGLLGRHLSHSYSPRIHACLGDYPYSLFEVVPSQLENFLKEGSFDGINVTIPYKKDVIPYLAALTPEAELLGAVNTIIRDGDRLIGHNTDYFGFRSMLGQCDLVLSGKKVLVLGSGGASNTVTAVLKQLGALPIVISRRGKNHYGNLDLHADASVIVNTTPVGMYPDTLISPIDLNLFPNLDAVLDVVYNPARTKLLMDAQRRSILTKSGLWMLVAQAKESAEWFTGIKLSDVVLPKIYEKLRLEMDNIVLIGMPGCGKTTTATYLAERLGRKMIDLDAAVIALAGCSIPEIFAQQGEEAFRKLETEVLRKYGKESGMIIATGGGSVTRPENYFHLHQNATIFWLTRDISKLPTEGRPLSQAGSLAHMYAARKPLYESFADHTVSNDGEIEDTVNAILAYYNSI